MERHVDETAIIIAGLGGQGIQLVAKVLARAAMAEGRHVMLSAEYGGEMRGGRSFASVVIGSGPLRSLPVIDRGDMAIVLHDKHWEESDHLLKAGGLAFVEAGFIEPVIAKSIVTDPARSYVGIGGMNCAKSVGSALGGGLALLGGFCQHTGVAKIDSLVAAMVELTPPYRQQHIPTNEKAIRGGAAEPLVHAAGVLAA